MTDTTAPPWRRCPTAPFVVRRPRWKVRMLRAFAMVTVLALGVALAVAGLLIAWQDRASAIA